MGKVGKVGKVGKMGKVGKVSKVVEQLGGKELNDGGFDGFGKLIFLQNINQIFKQISIKGFNFPLPNIYKYKNLRTGFGANLQSSS